MKYRSNAKYKSTQGFNDLLFNLLIGFVSLFVLVLFLIDPPTKKEIIRPKAEYLITMTWPDGDKNDIDLWVKNSKNHVSFSRIVSETMHLDRDDQGTFNDSIMVDGELKVNPANIEVVSIRQFVKSKYTVNVHWYKTSEDSLLNVPVTVEIIKINPYELKAKRTIILNSEGQEKTAFTFDMNENGWISNLTTNQEYWVVNKLIERRNSRREDD